MLQSDKDMLAHQVHLLNEQITEKNDKIQDLERLIMDEKERERLTLSTLQTEKLELLTSMSELKLHSAVLERENLELRNRSYASHFNNNTIGPERLPPVPNNTRLRTNSNSGSMVKSKRIIRFIFNVFGFCF